MKITVPLACHPATPSPAIRQLMVTLEWEGPEKNGGDPMASLRLRYRLEGVIDHVVWPELLPPPRPFVEGLWTSTCAEIFIKPQQQRPYREFNFAPSGAWACFDFLDERQRIVSPPPQKPDLHAPLSIRTESPPCGETVEVREICIDLPPAAWPQTATGFDLGLSMVVEHKSGTRSYWALHHPFSHPDFHAPASFALNIPFLV